MNQRNYQRELDGIIARQTAQGLVPSLFLHCCCAPCSSYVLEYLSRFFSITVFYYNPNISPRTEYDHRVAELRRLLTEMDFVHPVSFREGVYDPRSFFEVARGLENEPERGERCRQCFRLRLSVSAREAAKAGADYFTTTLTISPMKDAALLNDIGEEMGRLYGVAFLPSDFKKKGGYLRSIQLSKIHNLYRQNFCGCVFSKKASAK